MTNPHSRPTNKTYTSLKRDEGDYRNGQWRALTPKQQLESLAKRPGESKKQINKILERIETDETEG